MQIKINGNRVIKLKQDKPNTRCVKFEKPGEGGGCITES